VPLGRLGEADDVANGIVYLASDESRFMTGAELKLDGGISAK
jgi:NAD(P)-dependent dehydrogenase (short-subunit alcohol dehydrogenase family)